MSLLPVGFGASGDDYEITDSLRLRSSADASLARTFSTPTDGKRWTYSVWVKRAKAPTVLGYGVAHLLCTAGAGAQGFFGWGWNNADDIAFGFGGYNRRYTTGLFRDPSAWYHILLKVDTTQATEANRALLYVNGALFPWTTNSTISQNSTTQINQAVAHSIGDQTGQPYQSFDGYLTEVNFIDGQALTADDFGEYDANGVWKAKEYTGTYGTNGFYLPMKPTTQADGFNTVLYTGNDTTLSINGVGFEPDFAWIKCRSHGGSASFEHILTDTVRGANKTLNSDNSNTEAANNATGYLSVFDSDGFTVTGGDATNGIGRTYVAWCWDAGDNQPSTGHSSILYRAATTDGTYDIKGFGFNPDLIWIKNRDNSERHFLFDTVRGVDSSKALVSSDTSAEGTNGISGTTISTINDGFRIVESSINSGELYFNNRTYVAWGWDAGDGDPVSNTTGDINSTVKASDATGFSIVTYSANGSTGTIGHGLSSAPELIIVKKRNAAERWTVYHQDTSNAYIYLNETFAAETSNANLRFGNNSSVVAPTSSVFTVGNSNDVNGSGGTYVAYCFSEVSGVSKFGSYTGTGSSGKAITGLGFRPGFLMIKETSSTGNWAIVDGTRSPFGEVTGDYLYANLAQAEGGGSAPLQFDSDGFTINSGDSDTNASGQTYIYMAFKGSYSDYVSPLNETGTIDSRVKANPSKGFSIVSYEGNNGSNQTVGHGLGVTPSMFIIKNRTDATSWPVYHKDISNPLSNAMYLNSTNAAFGWAYWGTGGLSSTVLPVHYGGADVTNQSGKDYIAYCFAEVAGYSKFDKYTGNGSTTGPVITTGFRPAFLMVKGTSLTSEWVILDNTRDPNPDPAKNVLMPNNTNADTTAATGLYVKFTDTGFQPVGAGTDTNSSGATYIYMAFADTADARFNFDASGNKNNWLPNNINSNAESESTYDLMKDTPSLVDENAANFATLNPLNSGKYSVASASEANLKWTDGSGGSWVNGTIAVSSGKWYWETNNFSGTGIFIGVADATKSITNYYAYYGGAPTSLYYLVTGQKTISGVTSSFGAATTTSDLLGFALDADADTLAVYKNNILLGTMTSLGYEKYSPIWSCAGAHSFNVNFGQRPFAYTPPTGFLKLNTFNLPDSTIEDGSDYFNTVLYSGNSSTQSITGVGFQPDWLWLKSRSNVASHGLFDVLRVIGGAEAILSSNTTAAENTGGAYISSFDSDGFTVNANSSGNASGQTYVGWNWKANGSGVSNTDGTITSTVSANPTAGFSIVSFTAPSGTGNFSAGHGLGVTPAMVIVKTRDSGSAPWYVWQNTFSNLTDDYMRLNATNAKQTQTSGWGAGMTSSVIGLKAGSTTVATENHIAYCFAEVEGYSVFGSYTGNGSTDGPFIYTGFRPAFIITKNASGTGGWHITDTARFAFNSSSQMGYLDADTTAADVTARIYNAFSNGFQIRDNGSVVNSNGSTYIYMAFAENPFKNANAR